MYDVRQLIAAVRARNAIRVEPDDPIFALVTINELVIEELVRHLLDEISARLTAFNAAVEKAERRAGSLLAQEVAEAGARIRRELQSDIDAASLKALYLVQKVDQAHQKPTMIRWSTLGLSLALVLLLLGIFTGTHLHG